MNPDMVARLRDIQGLDEISWWPLATGWWLLALLVMLLLIGLVLVLRNLRRYPAGSWRRHGWKELRTLRRQADRLPTQQIAVELSELLRRIAIARLGRASAAGLSGADWLTWLQQHDPAGFDWSRFGKPLLTLPYAPPGRNTESADQLLALIDAALVWVEKDRGGQRV